ncbi:MAG TPA: hypothetical protein VMW31_06685 [Devosiaceae bacterium]|nr:hypothetical protein [Devosiaceae bacterium]
MISATRSRAESRFAAVEKRQQKVLGEHEEAARAVRERTARLRAERLAREAGERAEATAGLLNARKRARS